MKKSRVSWLVALALVLFVGLLNTRAEQYTYGPYNGQTVIEYVGPVTSVALIGSNQVKVRYGPIYGYNDVYGPNNTSIRYDEIVDGWLELTWTKNAQTGAWVNTAGRSSALVVLPTGPEATITGSYTLAVWPLGTYTGTWRGQGTDYGGSSGTVSNGVLTFQGPYNHAGLPVSLSNGELFTHPSLALASHLFTGQLSGK